MKIPVYNNAQNKSTCEISEDLKLDYWNAFAERLF